MEFKNIVKFNSVRLLILLLSSILFTVIVNSMSPVTLPLLLPDGVRPGLVEGSWQEKIKYIDIDEGIAEKIFTDQAILIDLRDGEDFDHRHAQGAVNLPYFDFDDDVIEFSKKVYRDTEIIIFCEGMLCGISARAARELMDLDYHKISIIKQGFDGWKNYNLSTEENGGDSEDNDAAE